MSLELDLQKQFEPFNEELRELEAHGSRALHTRSFDSRYIGGDSLKSIFALEDGIHVGKIAHATSDGEILPEEYINRKVPGLVRGIGEVCLEQIVAYSIHNPTTIITRKIDGFPLLESDRDWITIDQYAQLFTAFEAMDRLGLNVLDRDWTKQVLDSNPIMITGYEVPEHPTTEPQLLNFAEFISWGGRPKSKIRSDAIRYYVACNKLLGKAAGQKVLDFWRAKGREIPVIDYDCFERDDI